MQIFVLGLNDDNKKSPSLLGGAMIIAGTAIGAGMLANPTSTAGVWFIGSILAFGLHLVLYDHIRFDDLRSQLTLSYRLKL